MLPPRVRAAIGEAMPGIRRSPARIWLADATMAIQNGIENSAAKAGMSCHFPKPCRMKAEPRNTRRASSAKLAGRPGKPAGNSNLLTEGAWLNIGA